MLKNLSLVHSKNARLTIQLTPLPNLEFKLSLLTLELYKRLDS